MMVMNTEEFLRQVGYYVALSEKQAAEIDRLRKTLQKIVDHPVDLESDSSPVRWAKEALDYRVK